MLPKCPHGLAIQDGYHLEGGRKKTGTLCDRELKTLKDFDCKGCYCKLAPELKAEAIKWVKAMNKTGVDTKHGPGRLVNSAFMEFFNITEEDRKDVHD